MKKVLVTGADGFIGSHLTELLLQSNYQVRALSYYNSFNHWGWLEDIPENSNLEIVSGDIRDPFFVKSLMVNVDTVYHLAALIAIPYSYQAPQSYLETNVIGTMNIFQAAKEIGGIQVLHTSTSEVYGTAQYIPIDEKHPKQPQSPYSASKIAADAMAMSFYYTFELPVKIVRPFNTYGPRQSARAIIPNIITQIASGVKEIKLGDLTPTRDLNFVIDTCMGFLAIAKSDKAIGKEINISTSTEISMIELFNLIKNVMNSEVEFIVEEDRVRPEKSEVRRLCGDNSLLKNLTGYCPEISIREGIKATCDWFSKKGNLAKYKPGIYNL